MSRMRIAASLTVVALLLCLMAICQGGQFAPTTDLAKYQKLLELRAPCVAVVVSPEPGMEDPALLALLHYRYGVKVIVIHVTNGEGTPGDSLARWPSFME